MKKGLLVTLAVLAVAGLFIACDGTADKLLWEKKGSEPSYTETYDKSLYMMKGGINMTTYKLEWLSELGITWDIRKLPEANSTIREIEFTNTKPDTDSYTTECDLTSDSNGNVMGYTDGSKIWIVGEHFVGNPNCMGMFSCFSSLTDLNGLDKFDTSQVTDMSSMFFDCINLTSVNLINFDTSKVTDMSYLFSDCESLTSLDVSGFDTSNVTDMEWMFGRCENLTSLDLSNFNTSNVTNMYCIFAHCEKLTSLNISTLDTSNVVNMGAMFSNTSFTNLDLSSFNTQKAKDMGSMFNNCVNLQSITFSNNFVNSNVENLNHMFSECKKLSSMNVSNWDTSNVTSLFCTFSSCNNISSFDISDWDTTSVTNMNGTFQSCENTTSLDLSGWDTSHVSTMQKMFCSCTDLEELHIEKFTPAGDMSYIFEGDNALNKIYMNTSSTDFSSRFPNSPAWSYDSTNKYYHK